MRWRRENRGSRETASRGEAARQRRRGRRPAAPGPGPDLSQVAARKNLNETAFFFPHLLSDSEGR